MSTMNVSLPESMKAFIDEQVAARGYGTSSEYVRDLIRREQDREKLRTLLLEGAASPLSEVVADQRYFDGLRRRVRDWARPADAVKAPAKPPRRAVAKKTGAR
jgi:antitoxin ParD1/3/4